LFSYIWNICTNSRPEPTSDDYAVANFISLPNTHICPLPQAPNRPFRNWGTPCHRDSAPTGAERHSLRHSRRPMVDCPCSCPWKPRVLPQVSSRLWCFAGNDTPSSTSLKKGWV